MGFCRTNLFKRLESGGPAFLQSLERHVLRNFIFLHALENDLPLPIGPQSAEFMDASLGDRDLEDLMGESDDGNGGRVMPMLHSCATNPHFAPVPPRCTNVIPRNSGVDFIGFELRCLHRTWRRTPVGRRHALSRAEEISVLGIPTKDAKLDALHELLTKKYPNQKVLVFTQFADTLSYVTYQLKVRGITRVEGVSGDTENPTGRCLPIQPREQQESGRKSLPTRNCAC